MKAGSGQTVKSFSLSSYWKEILAVLMLLFAIFFFRAERKEWQDMIPQIRAADPFFLLAGLCVTGLYIFFQAGIYRQSFAAIGHTLQWKHAAILFLKRNKAIAEATK